ncbi:DUF6351 family protein [Curvibacter sp. HBC28]|uniref:DUF6351 family protein n=1 Tax=Curvibacter microcysteis TaxID=3026419 RepID=A0ABT5MKY9_9BURK|nr:DUF6351 family protein [Curvibacter sp. HBC28]MDD0815880.1 DUF6351 family protein [Curvibacter sp. HBC28]
MKNLNPKSVTWVLSLCTCAVITACGGSDSPAINAPSLQVLSSKPEFVSGGDALIDIALPPVHETLSAKLNGADVSALFKVDPLRPGHLLGRLTGLSTGDNTLTVNVGGPDSKLVLTNYPISGPILSGPQISPYNCQTEAFLLPDGTLLGKASDVKCSVSTKVQYLYQSTAGGALKPLPSTTSLPGDVATTTTTAGATVPFVVRVETGSMNRGIYQNAILHDPTKDAAPSPTTPPKGWNRKLIAVHGTGCAGGWYIQGAAMGVSPYTGTNLKRLGEGYAVFTNTLNHPTNSCNATVAGETTMMGKEHFIETFGVPTYTVSVGTSGGAYTSLQVGDAFPGLFDGVYIDATFPDALAIAMSAMDGKLLNRYLTGNNNSAITDAQMVKVSGHKSARAWYDLAVQSGRTDPVSGRTETIPVAGSFGGAYAAGLFNAAVPASQRWNASTNPTGARATVFDVNRNVFGVDASGYGLRPFDNVGVQYGLAQLNDGTLSKDQFLDLNEKIGGYDRDGNYTSSRTIGDAGAIARAYQSGLMLGGNGGLASIPVFDTSNFYDEDNFYHYQWFHFAVRERLRKVNGDVSNHVMWRGGVSFADLFGVVTPGRTERAAVSAKSSADGWAAFVQWIDAYTADTSTKTQKDKVIVNKPAQAVDGCFTQSTTPQFLAETQTPATSGAAGSCNAIYPTWTYPRAQAGASIAADKLKCQLKPIQTKDYNVTFTTAEMARLSAIFAGGVCDWSKNGVGQSSMVPYASFGPSPVNLVFDVTKP